jgi:hypothetical protein
MVNLDAVKKGLSLVLLPCYRDYEMYSAKAIYVQSCSLLEARLTLKSLSRYYTCTTCFNIPKLCILPAQCICVFHMVLTVNSINRLVSVVETWCVSCEVQTECLYKISQKISLLSPRGDSFEYLHLSPASHRRRRNGNSVSGGLIGPPCSCWI